MKTNILFLLFFFPASVFSQLTNHFDHLDSRWNVVRTFPNGNQQNTNFVGQETTVYGYQGDSLIGNELWNKLYSTQDSLFANGLTFLGLTRTDSSRILFLNPLSELDTLYDFNLNVGDYIRYVLNGVLSNPITVIQIDSIQLNGQFYRRFFFDEPIGIDFFDDLDEVWIEGIGSIHGPIFPNSPRKFAQEWVDSVIVSCTYSDAQQVWDHPSFDACYVQVALATDDHDFEQVTISPNPFIDNIILQFDHIEKRELILSNGMGQELMRKTTTTNSETVDLSSLVDGIYFITIQHNQQRSMCKLIKH